ncbi:centromere protein Scm3 [Colletotrichum simmondsii]|uniref:Centromere protein Scm3 n=1 Tax=Colletotrichum simmondsii TaxID=703756 RepID=A0A135TM04_9PEZI|nr:centromere protein Scm3 [Colletotrichum simmondsii]
MEPPAKRPRLGQKAKEDEDDELNYEPEEVSQMRDPGFRFEQSRAFAAFKLKSTFEHIFQKYEKDFTGIGDEIDLRTGKIITDNGHLAGMRYERDTGIPEDEEEDEDEGVLLEEAFASDDDGEDGSSGEDDGGEDGGSDASENEDDEERILHGKKNEASNSGAPIVKQKGELQRHPTRPNVPPGVSIPGSDQRLSSLAQPRQPGPSTSTPSPNVWGHEPEPVDPTWRVPEISKPKLGDDLMTKLYGARYRFPTSRGFKSVWSSRRDTDEEKALPEPAQIDMKQLIRARNEVPRMARPMSTKLLQAFTDQDDDNEDDILGVAVVVKGPRAANKTSESTDTALEEVVSPTIKNDARELEPPTEAKPSKSKPAISKTLSREIGWLNQNKTSVKEGPRPRRQLIPAKVIKPAEASQEAEATKPSQPTEKEAQDQSLESPTEVGVEAGAEAEVDVEVDQNSISFVTEKELRDRPKQRFVIELFSKIPSPEEITLVEDPEDIDIFDSDHQHEALAPQLANLTVSETTLTALVTVGDPAAGSVETAVPLKAPNANPAELPKETFVRHKIDPSYDFSDDEEGIPTTRIRKLRSGKEMDTIPSAVDVASPGIEATSEPSQLSTSEDHRLSHMEFNDEPFTTNKMASIEPSDINVEISEQQVDALAEVSEEQGSLQVEEVSERPIGSDMKFTTLSAEVLPEISPIEEHSATEMTNMTGVEAPSQNEVSAAQEPKTQESLEQNLHTPADQNMLGETILEEAQETQEQIHDDFQKEVQEEIQEEIQKEIQDDIEEETREGTDEEVHEQVQKQIQEETQDGIQQDTQSEPEKPQQIGETQQDDDEEVIEPFTIPLGLDDIDETTAPEADAESEAMEIELPILPPQSRGSLLGPPLRRGRQSSPTKSSGAVEKTATSPFKHMRLQSSSPLKKYSVNKSPAKTKKAVKPRPSASSERKTNPRGRKPAASTTAKSESLTPPPFSGPSPNSTQNQKAAPSTPSSSSRHHQPRTTRDSTSRRSFISLLSDDEDELTLDLFKTHTAASGLGGGGGGSSAERKRTSYTTVLLAGPHTKITTPMKQRSPLVPGSGNTGAGAAGATTTGTETTRGKKRKAAWAFATPTRVHFGSPSGSLVQTPGGNMRRCGEDGFRCDRDFCFTCL